MRQVFSPVPFKTKLRPCTDWFMSALINKHKSVMQSAAGLQWASETHFDLKFEPINTFEPYQSVQWGDVGVVFGQWRKEASKVKVKLLNNILVIHENTLQLLITTSFPSLYSYLPFSPSHFHLPSLVLCSDGLSRPFSQLFSTEDTAPVSGTGHVYSNVSSFFIDRNNKLHQRNEK